MATSQVSEAQLVIDGKVVLTGNPVELTAECDRILGNDPDQTEFAHQLHVAQRAKEWGLRAPFSQVEVVPSGS